MTDKPVRWVVDTHFHGDHYQGNSAYVNTWPSGLEIISSTAARDGIVQRGIPRIKFELATAPRQIEQLREQLTWIAVVLPAWESGLSREARLR